jgi:hypothetical protein
MIHNVQSNTAKFFIVNVNQKDNMSRRFLDRHHQALYQNLELYIYIYIYIYIYTNTVKLDAIINFFSLFSCIELPKPEIASLYIQRRAVSVSQLINGLIFVIKVGSVFVALRAAFFRAVNFGCRGTLTFIS